jgi:hypothetical protein
MGHFCLLVVTDKDPREPGVLARELRPFHTYETSDWNDEHVVNVDVTNGYFMDYTRFIEEQKGKVGVARRSHWWEFWRKAKLPMEWTFVEYLEHIRVPILSQMDRPEIGRAHV